MMNETTITQKKFSTYGLVMMAMFAAILCISSYISVPLPSGYHVTLLNFVILLTALIFPLEQSILIIVVWMLLGIAGVPVFVSGNAGIGYLLSPLGGYTVSFLLVAILLPLLRGKNYNRIRYLIVSLFSVVLIDLFGMAWLKILNGMSWKTAWVTGFFSFILLDIIKAVIAAQIAPAFRHIIHTQQTEA